MQAVIYIVALAAFGARGPVISGARYLCAGGGVKEARLWWQSGPSFDSVPPDQKRGVAARRSPACWGSVQPASIFEDA